MTTTSKKSRPKKKTSPKGKTLSLQPCSVALTHIIADHSLQIRAENDGDQVDNIKEAIAQDGDLPPIDLFEDESKAPGARFYIGDGWHRYMAAVELKQKDIRAIVHAGGRPAALKHALGANAAHGLRRSNKDKRRAVEVALKEFPKLSDRAIADLCKVAHPFVGKLRKELVTVTSSTRLGADGKERQMPAPKPAQTDFWDEINEVLNPIPKAIKSVCNGKWWIDDRISITERVDAAKSLEDKFSLELQRIKDLHQSLKQQATAEGSQS